MGPFTFDALPNEGGSCSDINFCSIAGTAGGGGRTGADCCCCWGLTGINNHSYNTTTFLYYFSEIVLWSCWLLIDKTHNCDNDFYNNKNKTNRKKSAALAAEHFAWLASLAQPESSATYLILTIYQSIVLLTLGVRHCDTAWHEKQRWNINQR